MGSEGRGGLLGLGFMYCVAWFLTCTHALLPLIFSPLPSLTCAQVSGMVVCVYGVAHGTLIALS